MRCRPVEFRKINLKKQLICDNVRREASQRVGENLPTVSLPKPFLVDKSIPRRQENQVGPIDAFSMHIESDKQPSISAEWKDLYGASTKARTTLIKGIMIPGSCEGSQKKAEQ